MSKRKDRRAKRRRERQAESELRKEAFNFLADNPEATAEDFADHVEREYGVGFIEGFDLEAFLQMAKRIFDLVRDLVELFNK